MLSGQSSFNYYTRRSPSSRGVIARHARNTSLFGRCAKFDTFADIRFSRTLRIERRDAAFFRSSQRGEADRENWRALKRAQRGFFREETRVWPAGELSAAAARFLSYALCRLGARKFCATLLLSADVLFRGNSFILLETINVAIEFVRLPRDLVSYLRTERKIQEKEKSFGRLISHTWSRDQRATRFLRRRYANLLHLGNRCVFKLKLISPPMIKVSRENDRLKTSQCLVQFSTRYSPRANFFLHAQR